MKKENKTKNRKRKESSGKNNVTKILKKPKRREGGMTHSLLAEQMFI